MDSYGKELILDLHDCDPKTFTRKSIKKFCKELCELIYMERCEFHFWDYEGDPEGYAKAPDHLKGTSAIQFITTSDIRIHALDKLERAYINIFSCKDFNHIKARRFTRSWFNGEIVNEEIVERI